jgi:hypothetical protein
MKNAWKNDGKIKKKRAYARKTRHVVHNNSKSTTLSPYSTYTDAFRSKKCQKTITQWYVTPQALQNAKY